MAAVLIPQGMPEVCQSTARHGIALCKVNGCTDPSLRWQGKPNSRPIHSIGISHSRDKNSPLSLSWPDSSPQGSDPYHRVREVGARHVVGASICPKRSSSRTQPLCWEFYKEAEATARVMRVLSQCYSRGKLTSFDVLSLKGGGGTMGKISKIRKTNERVVEGGERVAHIRVSSLVSLMS